MKTWIIRVAVTAFALLSTTPRADARPHRDYHSISYVYISGYRSCGTPVYTERYRVGHDRCGNPVWSYRSVKAPRGYHGRGASGACYSRGTECRQARPHHRSSKRGVVHIQDRFRR